MGGDVELARRLRLRDLVMLQEIAELGSMARAAERLGMSQPAVSKAVAEMERALGAPLLDRTPRGVEATPHGRALLRRGAAVLDELSQAAEELRSLSDPGLGRVRVGTTEPLAGIVSAAVDGLARRHPRMGFHVEVAGTEALFRRVRERQLDLALARTDRTDDDPELRQEALFHDPLVAMAGRRNPLLRRRRLELADLLGEPWILPLDPFLRGQAEAAFRARGLEPPPAVLTTPSVQMRAALMREGRFVSLLPALMLRFPAQYPGLAALPVNLSDTRRPIALVTLARRSPAPAARLFGESLRAAAKQALER